jgi:hypothetical protein
MIDGSLTKSGALILLLVDGVLASEKTIALLQAAGG